MSVLLLRYLGRLQKPELVTRPVSSQYRPMPLDDGAEPVRRVQRAVGRTALAGDAGREERVGDGRRGVPDEERGLERERRAARRSRGPATRRASSSARSTPVVRRRSSAGRISSSSASADSGSRRAARSTSRQMTLPRALPDRLQRLLPVHARQHRLLDEAVAAEALERLGRVARAALADPVLRDRGRDAGERLARLAGGRRRARAAARSASPPPTRCRGRRARSASAAGRRAACRRPSR